MKLSKLLLVLVPLCFLGCQKQYESIRLIPKGFQGAVAIIYKVKSGKISPEENGVIIYEIPSNGILKVQREVFYGNQEHDFYYVDSLGKREPLPYLKNWNKIDKNSQQVVCFNEIIRDSNLTIDGKNGEYKYTIFLVGQINKSDYLFKLQDSILEKMR